jgi:hypothetical protein
MCLADLEVARGIAGGRLRSMLRNSRLRRRARRGSAVAATVLAIAAFGGCGGDAGSDQTTAPAVTGASSSAAQAGEDTSGETASQDEPSSDPASDREKITQTIEGVLTGSDPAEICGPLVTERYVEHAYGDSAGCVKSQSKKAAAEKLQIGDIGISPEAVAMTTVRATGGVYDGQQLRAVLVLQDGRWRLDSLRSNVPVGP